MSQINEPLQVLLENLVDQEVPLRAALIYRLSEPTPEEFALVKALWPDIPVERRRTLLARMLESSEADFGLDFSEVAQLATEDPDPEVRTSAVQALWTSEQPAVMYSLIGLLENDVDPGVRAAAAEALGQFVLLGEMGHLPTDTSADAESALLEHGLNAPANSDLYRRALESLAYSSRREATKLIADGAAQDNVDLKASAILAMGRNGDSHWTPQILKALTDREPHVRFEAARASGEMSLTEAVSDLITLANDSSDREIQEMAIWSLGEVGGDDAKGALFALSESVTDEDLVDAVEDAINMAALSTGEFGMYIMGSDDADDDDLLPEDLEDLGVEDGDLPEGF